jgi:coenzyme F420-reducing hydrogenase beta subunit
MAKDVVRWVSSSGGMFPLAANYVLERGGHVCGAVFAEDFRSVRHTIIDHWAKLPPLMKSKYVQSDTNTVFTQIKALLETTEAPVLFCGCPCQVAGLYGFLGEKPEKLITLDLVCHGAPSPKAWKRYLDGLLSEKETISGVDFRPKENGWGHSIKIKIKMPDNSEKRHEEPRSGDWLTGFLGGYSTRQSCCDCAYAKIPRVGDITIADFWGIEQVRPDLSDGKGTSLVLVNSKNGAKLFEAIKKNMVVCESMPIASALPANGALHGWAAPHNDMRKCFFKHLDKHGVAKSMRYAKKEIFDVGLYGWWFLANYGSALTSYALYQTVRNLDLSVLMITSPFREE